MDEPAELRPRAVDVENSGQEGGAPRRPAWPVGPVGAAPHAGLRRELSLSGNELLVARLDRDPALDGEHRSWGHQSFGTPLDAEELLARHQEHAGAEDGTGDPVPGRHGRVLDPGPLDQARPGSVDGLQDERPADPEPLWLRAHDRRRCGEARVIGSAPTPPTAVNRASSAWRATIVSSR